MSQHRLAFVCLFTVLNLFSASATAHLLNMTELRLQLDAQGGGELQITIDLGQSLMSAEDYWRATQADADTQAQLLERPLRTIERELTVLLDGQRLDLIRSNTQISAVSLAAIENPLTPQMARVTYRIQAASTGSIEVALRPQLNVPWPTLLRIEHANSALPISRLLTPDHRSSGPINANTTSGSSSNGYLVNLTTWAQGWLPELTWVAVGFQHIVPWGADHILFVMGLFLLCRRWRDLLLQVSTFTVAHSITLALASYGVIQVPADIVEPMIAASIVYIAVESLFSKGPSAYRYLVILAFGLLHGLGFAGALGNLQLPADQFFSSLLLFNLGVELGQIAVLLLLFAIVGWLRGRSWYQQLIAQPTAVTIAGVGAYWLLKRTVF